MRTVDVKLYAFHYFLLIPIYLFAFLIAIMAAEEKRKQKEQIKIMKQQVTFVIAN